MFRSLFQPDRSAFDPRYRTRLELIQLEDRSTPAATGAAAFASAAGSLSAAAVQQPAATGAVAVPLANLGAAQGAGSPSGLAALGNTFASGANLSSTANGQLVPRAANGVAILPGVIAAAGQDVGPGGVNLAVPVGLGTMPGAAGSLFTGAGNLAGFGSVVSNSGVRTPAVPVAPTVPAENFVGASASTVIGTNQAIGLGVVSGTGLAQSYVPGQTSGVGTTPVFVHGTSEFDGLGTVGAF